jgi:hypothetical protein
MIICRKTFSKKEPLKGEGHASKESSCGIGAFSRRGDWLRLFMAGLDLWNIRALFHTEEG